MNGIKKSLRKSQKHGVGFTEAETVFGDLSAKMFYDDEHSDNEIREIIIGYSGENRLLAVCFTERENGITRIITARNVTNFERKDYEENERRQL